jgi:polyisoprenoid-binding protein YceI
MNKTLTLLAGMIAIGILSCSEAPKGDKATITDQQEVTEQAGRTYTVNTSESNVRFTGHGVGKNHPGNFKLNSGSVSVVNNQITGGRFEIDIKSMDVEQREEMFQTKLRPHLMSGDFFDAEKFDKAVFEITDVKPYDGQSGDTSIVEGANYLVSGNFTLKDATKNITFPAHIELDEDNLSAKGKFRHRQDAMDE